MTPKKNLILKKNKSSIGTEAAIEPNVGRGLWWISLPIRDLHTQLASVCYQELLLLWIESSDIAVLVLGVIPRVIWAIISSTGKLNKEGRRSTQWNGQREKLSFLVFWRRQANRGSVPVDNCKPCPCPRRWVWGKRKQKLPRNSFATKLGTYSIRHSYVH